MSLLTFVGGAGDEARTRDNQLGRLELYQLSYPRIKRKRTGPPSAPIIYPRNSDLSRLQTRLRLTFMLEPGTPTADLFNRCLGEPFRLEERLLRQVTEGHATDNWLALHDGRPVGFLMVMFVLALMICVTFLGRSRTTGAGMRARAAAREQNEGLKATALSAPANLTGRDAALAAALFGVTALGVMELTNYFRPPVSHSSYSGGDSGSSCSSGSSCGSSGCGSSCGGGGGCGGCGS